MSADFMWFLLATKNLKHSVTDLDIRNVATYSNMFKKLFMAHTLGRLADVPVLNDKFLT